MSTATWVKIGEALNRERPPDEESERRATPLCDGAAAGLRKTPEAERERGAMIDKGMFSELKNRAETLRLTLVH